ncbi:MAG TPA: hypothetical protein VFA29_01230 [Candidatus Baltobacteraceae bacterium]|nr:hypothetical protein [Candidatus Baltobacteraceae bacterium]
MKIDTRIIFIATAIALGACSGNFGTGTGMPQTNPIPPVGGSSGPIGPNGMPQGEFSAGPLPSPTPAGTYPITQAQTGFACPSTTTNYACTLKFNLPAPTPTPKPLPKGKKPTPTPSPTPTPTPTPSPVPSGSEGPPPSPTPTPPTITLKAEAMPKDAPSMVHTPVNSLDVVPLMMVTMTTNNGDFPLSGWAAADFTLPKEMVEGRGFALQLFQQTTSHRRTHYNAIWTFDKSILTDTTLTFNFQPPSMTIAKNSTYVLVLYADDKAQVTPTPVPTATRSAAPSSAPSSAPSGSPAPAATTPLSS